MGGVWAKTGRIKILLENIVYMIIHESRLSVKEGIVVANSFLKNKSMTIMVSRLP
jgi:hypothetical protein